MKSILFQWGPFTIYSYGTVMALSFVLAIYLLIIRGRTMGVERQTLYDMGVWSIIGGLAGARLAYVLFHWSEFSGRPLEILMIHRGGLAYYGGFIGGVGVLALYLKIKKLNFLKFTDYIMPVLALAHAIGRFGCFLNGCCFGKKTACVWAVNFPEGSLPASVYGVHHLIHPVQIYESISLMVLSAVLFWIDRRKRFIGQTFISYMILYSILRFTMEFLRGDNPYLIPGLLTIYQGVSILLFTAGLSLYLWCSRKNVRLHS